MSPIFSLQNYLPQLQEVLRKNGYPRFQRGVIQQINFGPDLKPNVETSWRLEFYDKAKSTAVLLSPDSVVLQTNAYTVFEDFERAFQLALKIVNESVQISVVERIGLRYVDWIRSGSPEKSAESLMKPGLRGLSDEEIGVKNSLRKSEIGGPTNVGRMIIRFYQQRGMYLPADTGPINLSYSLEIRTDETASLLDLDHQSTQSFDFSLDDISELAWKLHDPLDKAFRASVTSEALEIWGVEHV